MGKFKPSGPLYNTHKSERKAKKKRQNELWRGRKKNLPSCYIFFFACCILKPLSSPSLSQGPPSALFLPEISTIHWPLLSPLTCTAGTVKILPSATSKLPLSPTLWSPPPQQPTGVARPLANHTATFKGWPRRWVPGGRACPRASPHRSAAEPSFGPPCPETSSVKLPVSAKSGHSLLERCSLYYLRGKSHFPS